MNSEEGLVGLKLKSLECLKWQTFCTGFSSPSPLGAMDVHFSVQEIFIGLEAKTVRVTFFCWGVGAKC